MADIGRIVKQLVASLSVNECSLLISELATKAATNPCGHLSIPSVKPYKAQMECQSLDDTTD